MEVNKVVLGKMEVKLKEYPDNFFDSIVTDPPYGLSFMNKHWDYDVPTVEQWKEAYRVLKPGGFLLSFGGTRTYHRLVVNIEDAGFEIRDQIQWLYGSGFPKSLDISKAIDKQAGAEREVIGRDMNAFRPNAVKAHKEGQVAALGLKREGSGLITEPATDEAKQWEGWGTSLKPANEPICVARKPLSENTVAENILKWGTGGINIDACRIGLQDCDNKDLREINRNIREGEDGWGMQDNKADIVQVLKENGRFPANLILDEFMAAELDKQYGDSGGASRFFYVAKPSQGERNKGLRMNQAKLMDESREEGSIGGTNPRNRGAESKRNNFHPTVKPIELMRYLVKMITRKGGVCIDPFCGSGSTLIACKMEEINYVGIDTEPEYCEISEARIKAWHLQTDLFNE